MQRVVIVGAGARGNRVFAELIARHNIGFSNHAVVEPDPARRKAFRRRYDIPEERAFASVEEFLQAPRAGDIVFICTPDPTHFTLCREISAKGYAILLEKPVATSLEDSLALLKVQQTFHNRIFVAHVLRYAPFFRTIKDIVASGKYGAVEHLALTENVGHWHFAHSYVRGNWRRRADSAPVILTKSCHDLDIICWLLSGQQPASISSVGSLAFFRPEHAPPGAAERCLACRYSDECIYSAPRFYLNGAAEWPFEVIAPTKSRQARLRALRDGPYGRCVWHCDNDVCDNQSVLLRFASGTHATFGLFATTADNTRRITILFEAAELTGDLHRGSLTIMPFTGKMDQVITEPVLLPRVEDLHGGGDLGLLEALHEHLLTGGHEAIMTSLASAIPSHVLAFLADQSRERGGEPLAVPEDILPKNELGLPC